MRNTKIKSWASADGLPKQHYKLCVMLSVETTPGPERVCIPSLHFANIKLVKQNLMRILRTGYCDDYIKAPRKQCSFNCISSHHNKAP